MQKLLAWLQASRPLAQANIAVPLLFGQALALYTCGAFSWTYLSIALIFGVALELCIVYANDAADWQSDAQNTTFNRYSGGSRVIAEGKLRPDELLGGAAVAVDFLLLLAILAWVRFGRPWLALFVVLGVALLWAYSFRPLRLSYRGYGEWLQAAGVGVVLPVAGFYLQCGSLERLPWPAIAPSLALGWAGNLTTALPDAPSDALTGKRSYPVRRGARVARRDSLLGIALAALATPLVLPHARPPTMTLVAAIALALLAANASGVAGADAQNKSACARFVTLNGAAISVLWLAWSVVLAAG